MQIFRFTVTVILEISEWKKINSNNNNLLFNYPNADDKIFGCKFSINVKSKLYHIENSQTRGQRV